MVGTGTDITDEVLARELFAFWHATRAWAEAMLVEVLGVKEPVEVLGAERRGRFRIGHTNWYYRTHGLGVDVGKEDESDGIDFDFDKPQPDLWRLRIFAEKQLVAGNLRAMDYEPLLRDEGRFEVAVAAFLESLSN